MAFKNNDKHLLLSITATNTKPIKLINKNGANICWWNAFAQLFASTRNLSILNEITKFITDHHFNNNNEPNKLCWLCDILSDLITIMTDKSNLTNINCIIR